MVLFLVSIAVAAEPQLASAPEVRYPPGIDEGAVVVELRLRIDENGVVREVTVLDGPDPFVDAVLVALPEVRFEPVEQDGATVPAEFDYAWRFPEPAVNVEGRLLAAGEQQPLAGVPLGIGERSVTTGEDGRFALRNVAPGEHRVVSADPNVRLPETVFSLTEDQAVDLELWGVVQTAVDEVVGTYARAPRGPVHRTLDRDEVLATPGSIGDPIRALHGQPGLARVPLDAGWLLVRGGNHDDTGLFVDGVPVPLIFHLGGFTSILHPELIEQVRFYPNAYPARLGDALSGAVDLELRELPDRPVIGTGASLVFAHAYSAVPLGGDRRIAVAARRSYLDGILALVLDPERARIAPRFWDVSSRFTSGRVDVLVLGLSDAIEAPTGIGSETVDVVQSAVQVQAHLKADAGDWEIDVQPWMLVQAQRIDTAGHSQGVKDLTPGLRLETSSPEAAPWRFTGGIEANHLDFHVQQDRDVRAEPLESVHPYVQLATGTVVSGEVGLRGEGVFVPGHLPRFGASPRGTVRWALSKPVSVFAEAGRYHQIPNHLLLLGFPDGIYLPLEVSEGVSSGVRVQSGPVSVDADVYYRHPHRLAEFERDGSVGQLSGDAYGVETFARVHAGPVRGQILYQYSASLLREDADDLAYSHPLRQPHRLETSAIATLPRNWTLAARFRLATGFLAPPGVTDAYDLLRDDVFPIVPAGHDETLICRPADYCQTRMPPFHALDLKVQHRVTLRRARVDLSLDLQNAYNRRVPELLIDGIDGSATGVGFGLPILPIFGVDAYFWP